MPLLCKSTIFSGDCSARPRPQNASVKSRFKAILQKKKLSRKALNRDLTLPLYGRGAALQSPLKIMDLQNKNISVVRKH